MSRSKTLGRAWAEGTLALLLCACTSAGESVDASSVDGGSAVDAGGADSGPTDAGGATLPDQNGGACTFDGRRYDDCYVGQRWTGERRFVEATNTLVLRSSVSDSSSDCVLVRNADGIDLIDLTVSGCDRVGIKVSQSGPSVGVRILGGLVEDTGRTSDSNGSCVTAAEGSGSGVIIDGLTIQDCGFDDLDHGLYVQQPDYAIRNVAVGDVTGNGISVRSSGVVETCTVRGRLGSGKARIRYFNDHPCGPSDTVRFLNNDVDYDVGGADLDISLEWSSGNDDFACGRYEIRGNGPVEYRISSEFDSRDVTLVE